MIRPPLRYTSGGVVLIQPGDDPLGVVDTLVETEYEKEFCLAASFDPYFAADLMAAGFLLMAAWLAPNEEERRAGGRPLPALLPKIHLQRSVLFFPELRVKKSIRSRLSRYRLLPDLAFDRILDRAVEVHGEDWLTSPLRELLRRLRRMGDVPVRPVSFALYREGELVAGELGVVSGRVYTSYTGYHDEDNAGTAQIILMCRYLEMAGFSFLDLGMPLPYKDALGARNLEPARFMELFRAAQI